MTKRTKIVATVGPACEELDMLRGLAVAGVDVFRVNFSHGSSQERKKYFDAIRSIEKEVDRPLAICGDLCGPKIRVGMIAGDKMELKAGNEITIQRMPIEGTPERISTTYPELIDHVKEGELILLSDGRLKFTVIKTSPPDEFTCRIEEGGTLSNGKGINVPDTDLPISPLTEKDREDIQWISQYDFDYVALSFVQKADDINELRSLLEAAGSEAHIIAKIEKPQAMKQIDSIIEATDAVMVARGDLGVEMDFPCVPISQKTITYKCEMMGKPCIVATEMLESMTTSSTPTRAEVSDVANAVFDHAHAVMLSAESSIGKHPIKAVAAMKRIILEAENYMGAHRDSEPIPAKNAKTTVAIASSIRSIMKIEPISMISVYSASGLSTRLLSCRRPGCEILSMSPTSKLARRACLYYGVVPHVTEKPQDFEQLVSLTKKFALEKNYAEPGEKIIILVAYPVGVPGGTKGLVIEEL